jgi:glycosyltransferase involved in cell wall biosynthesis
MVRSILKKTLLSVVRQTTLPLEIIVVDDGSQDNTCEVIESFIYAYPEITTTLVKGQHLGPGAARNTGIATARGSWIAFLDSDDLWFPKKLEVTANYYKHNTETNFICHNEIHRKDDADKQINYFRKYDRSKSLTSQLFQGCFLSTSAIVCKKNLLSKYDGFDISLPNSQDFDLWLRMSPKIRLLPIPDLLGIYVARYNNISSGPILKRAKNLFRVYQKNKYLVSNLVYFNTLIRFLLIIMLEFGWSVNKSLILKYKK